MTETFSRHIARGIRAAILGAILLPAGFAHAAPPTAFDPRLSFVLPADLARDALQQCSRTTPTGVQDTWLPTGAQIRELEAHLPPALARALTAHGGSNRARAVMRHLHNVGLQYAGFVVAGRKIIYVNGFPVRKVDFDGTDTFAGLLDAAKDDHAIVVCDGGDSFFGVEYDPAKKTFAHFAFNGVV